MHKLIIATVVACALPAFAAGKFTLESSDVKPNSTIGEKFVFSGMGCGGENLSPQLSWKNAPKDTKTFAVTVYDPDAPTGSGWWHWLVYNIPAGTTELAQGAGSGKAALPSGAVQANTDFGQPGYGGPCPPPGPAHHYVFTVYALKTDKIEVPANATAAMVGFNLHANALGSASFKATYSRKK
jgi:Raf kinase inhibitor-like YbhB/YbcL family protein